MRTEQTYRDYKLTVEWRFTKAGNTGVLVHMGLPDKVWPRCFECQGMHNHQGDFWLWGGADCKEPKIPGKNGIAMPEKSNEKDVGEWNTYEVDCSGDTIKIIVNGKLMNTATGCNETSGRIGIQSEGGEIEVRKITLEPLKN
jgi:3-keto-disaccharide hydrolase